MSNQQYTKRLLSDCEFETVSRWGLELLLRQYEVVNARLPVRYVRKANVAAELYYNVSVIPGAASLRGHLFERQVLNHFCGIRTECEFSIHGLTDSDPIAWTYRGPTNL